MICMDKKDEQKYALVYDLGGTKLKVSIVDNSGRILGCVKREDVDRENGDSGLNEQGCRMAKSVYETNGVTLDKVVGIGVGAAGVWDFENNTILEAPNLDIKPITLPKEMGERFGKPVFGANDCTAGAWAAYLFGHGKGKNYKVVVYMTISSGTNIGVIINGEAFNGAFGVIPEFGHMTMNKRGNECSCGGIGHYEAHFSGGAVVRNFFRKMKEYELDIEKNWVYRLAETDIKQECGKNGLGVDSKQPSREEIIAKISAKHIYQGVRLNDFIANEATRDVPIALANAFEAIIACYGPNLIEIGGSMMHDEDLVLKPAIEELYSRNGIIQNILGRHPTVIVKSDFVDDIVTLGAAANVFKHMQ